MGGYGSGRYGYFTTSKLEDGLRFPMSFITKETKGCSIAICQSISWYRRKKKIASVGYDFDISNPKDMFVRLYYTVTEGSGEKYSYDYKIQLIATRPHFGGQRLWFCCPHTGKRAAVLYKPYGADKFASRHAFRLKYASQSKCPADRAIDKMWELKNKIGGVEAFPHRPKGMHHKTYHRLFHDCMNAEHAATQEFISKFPIYGGL